MPKSKIVYLSVFENNVSIWIYVVYTFILFITSFLCPLWEIFSQFSLWV
jgi:hypothetical protein